MSPAQASLMAPAGYHWAHEIWAWLKQIAAMDGIGTSAGQIRAYKRECAGARRLWEHEDDS